MKYKTFNIIDRFTRIEQTYVLIDIDENNRKTFSADQSNPDYVQFLADAQLTEAQVAALKPNTWYEL